MKAKRSKKPIAFSKENADKEWSKIIHDIYNNRCAFCGETFALAAHHIRSRRFASTRWYIPNGILLCRSHHYLVEVDYESFRRLLSDKIGDPMIDHLFKESKKLVKVNRLYMDNIEEYLDSQKVDAG